MEHPTKPTRDDAKRGLHAKSERQAATGRAPYASPHLLTFGTIHEITQNVGTRGRTDSRGGRGGGHGRNRKTGFR